MPLSAGVVDRSQEVSQYTKLIKSSSKNVRFAALTELAWVGLSDQVLFGQVADQLQQKLVAKTLDSDLEETKLLMAALSGSGLTQFDAFFSQVGEHAKSQQLKAEVGIAKIALVRSAKLNPIKSSDQYVSAQVPFSVAVFLNFIYADELIMKRQAVAIIGAERMSNHHILQAVEANISNHYLLENDDVEWGETYLQMCDVLVYAGGVGYGPLIREVARNAVNASLRKGAKDLIGKYELHQNKRL
jgi:tetrahydromethanopterin S-methyltransferase subunit H